MGAELGGLVNGTCAVDAKGACSLMSSLGEKEGGGKHPRSPFTLLSVCFLLEVKNQHRRKEGREPLSCLKR